MQSKSRGEDSESAARSKEGAHMQVFLCWSGAASHQIAQALHGFLGDVIQDLKPFLSSAAVGGRDRETAGRNELRHRVPDKG